MRPVSWGKAAVSTWSHRHKPSPPDTSPWASCSHQGQQASSPPCQQLLPPAVSTGRFRPASRCFWGFWNSTWVPISLVPTTHLESRTLAGGVAPLQGLPSRSSLLVSLHPALEPPPVTCQSAPQESREVPTTPGCSSPKLAGIRPAWGQELCPGARCGWVGKIQRL